MRIIAGKYRGLKLFSPKDEQVRPTTDKIKEDIFNILSPYTPDSVFLDLFSGSGAIGLEALSRGAKRVDMVDEAAGSILLMKKNASLLKNDEPNIIKRSAANFLIATNTKYDIIFMDPPYAFPAINKLIKLIDEQGVLSQDGIVLVEHSSKSELDEQIGNLVKYRTKKYNTTELCFYTAKENL